MPPKNLHNNVVSIPAKVPTFARMRYDVLPSLKAGVTLTTLVLQHTFPSIPLHVVSCGVSGLYDNAGRRIMSGAKGEGTQREDETALVFPLPMRVENQLSTLLQRKVD